MDVFVRNKPNQDQSSDLQHHKISTAKKKKQELTVFLNKFLRGPKHLNVQRNREEYRKVYVQPVVYNVLFD